MFTKNTTQAVSEREASLQVCDCDVENEGGSLSTVELALSKMSGDKISRVIESDG